MPRKTQDRGRDAGVVLKGATWFCRACFAIVFIVNVQCAFGYVIAPDNFTGGFQLSGIEGAAAVQGLGIAFLMWNATYPAFIVSPLRFRVLGIIVLVQQMIGLIGESMLYFSLPVGYAQLSQSILRFIQFDAVGLILMLISFVALCVCSRTCKASCNR